MLTETFVLYNHKNTDMSFALAETSNWLVEDYVKAKADFRLDVYRSGLIMINFDNLAALEFDNVD